MSTISKIPHASFREDIPPGTAAESMVISLENLAVHHGQHPILSGVNVRVKQGEFVYIVGRSGAGKSSLLKVIYGEHKPEQGLGMVLGENIYRLNWRKIPKFRRKMGIISSEYPLLLHLSIYKNLELVLRAVHRGLSKKQKIDKITAVLSMVSLEHKMYKMPFELSMGEKQRIQVARALINAARMIIADEPTANLDPETSLEVVDVMYRISKKHQITFLVATNDHSVIRHYPSRVLLIRNGNLSDYASLQNVQI